MADYDPRIARHLKNLEAAAASRDVEQFGKALLEIRNDATLNPAQVGALVKIIAQEQGAAYADFMTAAPAADPVKTSSE